MIEGDATDALEQALALLSKPDRATLLCRRPLPSNVLALIRIVAGDGESIVTAATRTGETSHTVVDAARLYVQRVLFDNTADSYRMLGVRSDAAGETIKLHYRYLMRWLHPDRQPERWEVAYAERVNHAWHSLNTTERRTRYDDEARLLANSPGTRGASRQRHRIERVVNRPAHHPILSSRAVRWLPGLVIGSLAMSSALVLGFLYWLEHVHDPAMSAASATFPVGQDASSQAEYGRSSKRTPKVGSEPIATQANDDLMPGQGAPASAVVPADGPSNDMVSGPAAPRAGSGIKSSSTADNIVTSRAIPEAPMQPASIAVPDAMDAELASVRQAVEHRTAQMDQTANASGPTSDSLGTHKLAPQAIAGIPILKAPVGKLAIASRMSLRDKFNQDATEMGKQTAPLPDSGIAHSSSKSHAAIDAPVIAAVGTDPTGTDRATVSMQAANQKPNSDSRGQSPEDGAVFVTRAFVSAYAKGDLQQFLHLFAPDAVNDRGGIDAITDDYSSFFRDSKTRTLRLEHMSWIYKTDRIVGTGSFGAHFVDVRNPVTHDVRGWMRIEAVPIDGLWKIKRLQHGNSE